MASRSTAEWSPPKTRPKKRPDNPNDKCLSRLALDNLQPGECKRFVHHDLMCGIGGCSLAALVSRKRQAGWRIEMYHERMEGHERMHYAVVRRTE